MCEVQISRIHYNSADGALQLRYPLEGLRSIRLLHATVPTTFYQLDESDFIYTEDGGADIVGTIPAGNYSSTSFAGALKAQLEASSGLSRTYTVETSQITGLLTIAPNAGTVGLKLGDGTSSLDRHFGMSGTIAPTTQIVGTNVVATGAHILELFVRCPPLSAALKHNTVITNSAPHSVIWAIPLTEPEFSFVYYDGSTAGALPCNPNHQAIHSLEFSLVDRRGKEIDLNGHPINIVLEVARTQDYAPYGAPLMRPC